MGKKIKILVIFCALLSAACGRKGKEEPTHTVNETTAAKQTENNGMSIISEYPAREDQNTVYVETAAATHKEEIENLATKYVSNAQWDKRDISDKKISIANFLSLMIENGKVTEYHYDEEKECYIYTTDEGETGEFPVQ